MNKEIEISPKQIAKAINNLLDEKEQLQQENNQLKLDFELYKDNHIYKNYEVERLENTIKELRSWLEFKIKHGTEDVECYESVFSKLDELEGYNEKS